MKAYLKCVKITSIKIHLACASHHDAPPGTNLIETPEYGEPCLECIMSGLRKQTYLCLV